MAINSHHGQECETTGHLSTRLPLLDGGTTPGGGVTLPGDTGTVPVPPTLPGDTTGAPAPPPPPEG